jgi:hypothetical protein
MRTRTRLHHDDLCDVLYAHSLSLSLTHREDNQPIVDMGYEMPGGVDSGDEVRSFHTDSVPFAYTYAYVYVRTTVDP